MVLVVEGCGAELGECECVVLVSEMGELTIRGGRISASGGRLASEPFSMIRAVCARSVGELGRRCIIDRFPFMCLLTLE